MPWENDLGWAAQSGQYSIVPFMISFPQHLHTGPRTQDNFFTHPGQIRLPFGMTIWPQTGQRRGNNRSSIIFIKKFIYSPYRQSWIY